MLIRLALAVIVSCVSVGVGSTVAAEIKVGAVLSLTGPAASLGIPQRNTIDIIPRTFGADTVRVVVLDDASEPANAVKAARKLVDEEKVDLIIGPSISTTSLAVLEVIGQSKTPMISLAGSSIIITPPEGNKAWSFMLAPAESTMGYYMFKHLAAAGKKTVAFIGFNDAYGDSFLGEMRRLATKNGLKVLADERYARTDTSVTPQVLRVIGGQLNGSFLAVSPVLVAEQLPETSPVKKIAVDYVTAYEAKFGPNSRALFGATVWDAFLIASRAAERARVKANPGTPEFRAALREALEGTTDFVASQGIFTMNAADHNVTDLRAQVLVAVKDGRWSYVPLD